MEITVFCLRAFCSVFNFWLVFLVFLFQRSKKFDWTPLVVAHLPPFIKKEIFFSVKVNCLFCGIFLNTIARIYHFAINSFFFSLFLGIFILLFLWRLWLTTHTVWFYSICLNFFDSSYNYYSFKCDYHCRSYPWKLQLISSHG